MTADQQVANIKVYLAGLSLHASPEWIEGCVEFFISTHDQMCTPATLKDFVLQQWKLADLREMGQGCLPPNLNNVLKTMLSGKYALQIESIQDVGQAAYTQLQHIRKLKNEDTLVGADLPQTWEPRPTRMLKLTLSDGIQDIVGIEYRSIMSLGEQLLPGCKVLVIGPVECRRGVILLQEKNLQIIGGEVDSLLIPNAIENVLARKLNLTLNADPYGTQTAVNVEPQTFQQEPAETINNVEQQFIQQNYNEISQVQVTTTPVHRDRTSRLQDELREEVEPNAGSSGYSDVPESDRDSQLQLPKDNKAFQEPSSDDVLRIPCDSKENLRINSENHFISQKDDQMETAVTSTSCKLPLVTDSFPFVYISQIKMPVRSRCVFTVKAFLMTLLSQITLGKDGWKLLVQLCDGSANLAVNLSSDVLEKIIGFSKMEMHAMRQEMSESLFKDKLRNLLHNAQQQLIGLNCLLDIEFQPNMEVPCVTALTEITEQHLQALQSRVMSSASNLT